MQLVINVSDYDLEYIRNMYDIPKDISVSMAEALLNGRKIPPHGRLIDADKLEEGFKRAIGTYLPKDPTRHMSVADAGECRGWTQALMAVLDAKTVIEAEE